MAQREFDVILFGATGFTGKLVADHFAKKGGTRWAIAGRNRNKLEALGLAGVPIIVADAMDAYAMEAVAQRTKVVCTTVGPFSRYGSALVAACAKAGTHYCDLTAEVHWMRAMIDQHDATAKASGARIVHACGFDSIPSDLGTFLVQDEMVKRFGKPGDKVTAYYGSQKGGISGGTLASAIEIARASKDRAVRRVLCNPYGLDPDPKRGGPPAPDEKSITWDAGQKMLTMPFAMAASNTRIVRRSHALAGYLATSNDHLRELIAKKLPQPGEGPSLEARTSGFWKLKLVAESGNDTVAYHISDVGDPGYASTARMLAEAALCLAHDALDSAPGFTTPAVAMGHALARRLRDAGLELRAE